MLLTLTATGPDADGLGFLLHKHPDRVQRFSLAVGEATVFYPESGPGRTTAALLLEVDPIGLVHRRGRQGWSLFDHVTDRPYAASSFLSVALGKVFNTALTGRCDARPELAASPLPLEIRVPALPSRPTSLARRLFEPLGWTVDDRPVPLVDPADSAAPASDWGDAPYVDLTLTGTLRLADALSHLYVLLPVLDDAKHYWVSSDEVDKLVRRGGSWLAGHPERELITRRYLGVRRSYVEDATARLDALDERPPTLQDATGPDESDADTATTPLKAQRLDTVLELVREIGARRVADIGCGEGVYLRALLGEPQVEAILGVDVSPRELARAERRLGLDRLSDHQRARITLRQGSVTYVDNALAGYDAILLVEVVEHVDPDRLPSVEASVFGAARPAHVIVTTPNREHNAAYGLPGDAFRHPDHRFEWTRAEFAAWADGVAGRHGYRVDLRPVGEPDADHGPPTQLALFTREDA